MQAVFREGTVWCKIPGMNCIKPALESLCESAASDQR